MAEEFTGQLNNLAEKVRFSQPHFGFLDVDGTLNYKGQNPRLLIQTVSLMSRLATPAHNLYLTFNTQHLADAEPYQSLWDLRWQLPDGLIVPPPFLLEMGLIIGQLNRQKNKVDYEFGQHHRFDAPAYAKNIRPKIMELIAAAFPDLTTFESGLVLIGAQILPAATKVYGANPKAEMKPILEKVLAENHLDKDAFAITAGADLDVAPLAVRKGKRLGLVTFYKKLRNIFPGFNLPLDQFLETFYFADDKGYAGRGLLEPMAMVNAGAVVPENADAVLQNIPGVIHVPKQGPSHILQSIMEHALI